MEARTRTETRGFDDGILAQRGVEIIGVLTPRARDRAYDIIGLFVAGCNAVGRLPQRQVIALEVS